MMGSDMNNARPNKATFFFPSGLVDNIIPAPIQPHDIGVVHKTRQFFHDFLYPSSPILVGLFVGRQIEGNRS